MVVCAVGRGGLSEGSRRVCGNQPQFATISRNPRRLNSSHSLSSGEIRGDPER